MSEWIRVSKRHRCPICDHADWCLISDDGKAAICPRIESDEVAGDAGWLHRLADRPVHQPPHRPRHIALSENRTVRSEDIAALSRRLQTAADRYGKLDDIAEGLGLAAVSLIRFGVGWSLQDGFSSWPMFDSRGRIVGITRRFADDAKRIMSGHRAGLYMPADLPEDMSPLGLPLLVCEGASDAVAGLDIGFWAIGRFSCTHGARSLVDLIHRRKPRVVVIVGDADGPGCRGAEALASALLPYVPLKLIVPPAPYNDLRAWRRAGATIKDVDAMINSTKQRQLTVRARLA